MLNFAEKERTDKAAHLIAICMRRKDWPTFEPPETAHKSEFCFTFQLFVKTGRSLHRKMNGRHSVFVW